MRLNTLKPAEGSKTNRKRVGRGIGCGNGKTCGRGHKGQRSRSGGYHKVGFEGGQMPLQRRIPKFGFKSRVNNHTEQVRLSDLNSVTAEVIDVDLLKAMDLIKDSTQKVKVFLSGEISKSFTLKGIAISRGARAAIEAAGGKIEE